MSDGLLIGLDLDNTIIDYGAVFAPVAKEIGLLPSEVQAQTKTDVKRWLLSHSGEEAWMKLQGQVYGKYIQRAQAYEGCKDFIRQVKQRNARVTIISHKTKLGHFDPAKVNLHDAAFSWLQDNDFVGANGLGINPENIHFRETREQKIETIAELGCNIFIDDLPEVLLHPSFPKTTAKLWFINGRNETAEYPLLPYRKWSDMLDNVKELL